MTHSDQWLQVLAEGLHCNGNQVQFHQRSEDGGKSQMVAVTETSKKGNRKMTDGASEDVCNMAYLSMLFNLSRKQSFI